MALASRTKAPNANTIVVLPFESRISDESQVHLATAASGGVIARLSAIGGVTVLTRWTTERAWAEAGGRLDKLADTTSARYIVTGTVTSQRGGAAVSVRIVGNEVTAWEREFLYPQTPLRVIQNEIASAVAKLAGVTSLPTAEGETAALDATYDDIALGDYYMSQHDSWAPDSARRVYARALVNAPRSAALLGRLARSFVTSLERTGRAAPFSPPNALREADSLVERALAIDSNVADVWTARAVLNRYRDPKSLAGAVRAHERAIALTPSNADARQEYAVTLLRLGRDDAAEAQLRQAIHVDRDRAPSLRLLAELEYVGRRYQNACALVNASIGADSFDPDAYALRARVRVKLDEFRDAFSDAETARRLSSAPWGETLEFYLTAIARDFDAARAESRRLSNDRLRPGASLGVRDAAYLGMGLGVVGDKRQAFDALLRARPRGAEFRAALRDPGFDALRNDPRFSSLLRGDTVLITPRPRRSSATDRR
jgi:TolB-like protein/Tfp pilus assembly protein PilF